MRRGRKMNIVYFTFFGAILFLFPIVVSAEVYADFSKNRLWFSVRLFRRIRIFGGYAQFRREGIALHLSATKAVIIRYSSLSSARKKFEITKGFQLTSLHQIVEVGNSLSGTAAAAAAAIFGGSAFSVLHEKFGILSLRNRAVLYRTPHLNVSLRAAIIFNGLVLFLALFKKITEVFLIWIRKIKLTVFSKKQRGSSRAS